MNAAASHFPSDILELYTLGKLSEQESEPLEEHLLLCSQCQAQLEDLDDFIQVIKTVLTDPAPPPPTMTVRIPLKKPKRWESHCHS